jgi:carbamoyl-phosphate synthase large subunit
VPASLLDLDYVGVKAPQFSFSRIKGADPALRVEMASTGEVACLGHDLPEAFLKAILSAGFRMPEKKRVLLSIGSEADKIRFLPSARLLRDRGFLLYATRGTSRFLASHGVAHTRLYKIRERRSPSLLDFITPDKIDLILNVPLGLDRRELTDGYIIRRRAIDYGVPLITNLQLAELLVKSLAAKSMEDLKPLSYEAYVPGAQPARSARGEAAAPLTRMRLARPRGRGGRGRSASALLQADLA